MPAVREILIGRRSGDHALLTVRGRLFPEGGDPDWLWAAVTVRIGGFGCHQEGDAHAAELHRFRVGIEGLHDGAETEATLATEDGWLTVDLASGADDAVTARVRVRDRATPPNELRCTVTDLDRAGLVSVIESLREVDRAYPSQQKR